MVIGGTCSIALCIQVLQCCLLRFCDKEEKVSVLQLRSIENPMTVQVGTTGNIKIEEISIEEDPKN